MLSALQPVVYIQISPERLTLKNLGTGETLSEIPELAISMRPKFKILAVGPEAGVVAASQRAELLKPFAHPRSLVSDFTVAEQLLKHQLRRVLGKSLLSFAPRVVMHPLGSPAGGFTQIERRAFREMALGAGASEVVVWSGRPLTDHEVLSRQPPASGGGSEEREPRFSLEQTCAGLALGPSAGVVHHPAGVPGITPAPAARLKPWAAHTLHARHQASKVKRRWPNT